VWEYDPVVAPIGEVGERYATQVGALWCSLARTLAELDQVAADPVRIDPDDADTIRRLQYRLHCASEDAFALAPPAGVERVHTELASALEAARDATADVLEALEEDGPEAVLPCVYEWRGALFRVRLARLRLAPPRAREPEHAPLRTRDLRRPLAAAVLVVAGAAAFTTGAVAASWPLWVAGLLAICVSFFAYRP